jgi:hypothetical protein
LMMIISMKKISSMVNLSSNHHSNKLLYSLLDQKDLGCLLTVTIDRIQFPIQLGTRPGKDRIDDQTSVFVQYRLYDKSISIILYFSFIDYLLIS